jgi:dolichol-phosphate mannosyltransferase
MAEVSIVVPLFNEAENIGYLQRTMVELRRRLASTYRVHLVLVDDGSLDGTGDLLVKSFGELPDCQIVRLPKNGGVAAAILEGIRRASTEIVCSIDCDCSYDPSELLAMIPLAADADLVTASPYHPQGHVFNVPQWRLFLSRTLPRLYSLLLHDRLYTYTSCCRVYRRSAIADLTLENGNFLGVAETLIRLKLAGGTIVEQPATLESRLFGESKMKIVRTIAGHCALLLELATTRSVVSSSSDKSSRTRRLPDRAS